MSCLRADSTSISISGSVLRALPRNLSESRWCSIGSTAEIRSRWLTRLPAPDPRACTRMPMSRMSSTTSATVRKYGSNPKYRIVLSSSSRRSLMRRRSASFACGYRSVIESKQRLRNTRIGFAPAIPIASGSGILGCLHRRSVSGSRRHWSATRSVWARRSKVSVRRSPAYSVIRRARRCISAGGFSQACAGCSSKLPRGWRRAAESRTSPVIASSGRRNRTAFVSTAGIPVARASWSMFAACLRLAGDPGCVWWQTISTTTPPGSSLSQSSRSDWAAVRSPARTACPKSESGPSNTVATGPSPPRMKALGWSGVIQAVRFAVP